MKKEYIGYSAILIYVLGYALIGARSQPTDNWYYFEFTWQKTYELLLWVVAWKYFHNRPIAKMVLSFIIIVQGYRLLYEVAEWADYKHWYQPDMKLWLSSILFIGCGLIAFICLALSKHTEKYLK